MWHKSAGIFTGHRIPRYTIAVNKLQAFPGGSYGKKMFLKMLAKEYNFPRYACVRKGIAS